MELLLLVVIRYIVFSFGFDELFYFLPPLTYQNLLFILISIVLFTISWLFSTFIKMPNTKASVCIWSLMQFACLHAFILTYCGSPGEEDLQTIKGQKSVLKSSLRCMICVLRHTHSLSAEIVLFFFNDGKKISVSLFSCSVVVSPLRALGRGQFQATCP